MNLKVDKSVKNFLLDFGLTDKEITVYTTLLKTGPNTIMNLARETGIKRSTTHNTVEELIKKGLVSQTNYGERRMVIAEDPDKLKFLMEQKKWDINKLEKNLPEIISTITAALPNSNSDDNKMEVKYYTGIKGVQYIYSEAAKSKELRSYVNISRIFETFPENPQLFPDNVTKGLQMWEFIEDSPISREYVSKLNSANYRYKFFPKKMNMDVFDYMIFDNKVAIITSDHMNHVTGILIQNKNVYENAKFVFEMTWELAPIPNIK